MDLNKRIETDLSASGLVVEDIRARVVDMSERMSCGLAPAVDGYVIPYYSFMGKPLPFFRTKLFNYDIK